jgi:hypothetical protein
VDLPEAFFQLCKNVLRSKGLDGWHSDLSLLRYTH